MSERERAAIVGTGNIGRSWAIVFARAGFETRLYDPAPDAARRAIARIEEEARRLVEGGLIDAPEAVTANVAVSDSLAEAVAGADYVQESAPEDRDVKATLFRELDALAAPETLLASSCSAIPGSAFMDVPGARRCLVAHPVSPPHLVPLVEIAPTPRTEERATARVFELMRRVGQTPVRIEKETFGFALNRLQAALVNEAVHLVADGVVSVEDLDKCVRDGLGLRWAFMGPFETMDLNDDDGFAGYARKYAGSYGAMGGELKSSLPWPERVVEQIAAERRALFPEERIAERQLWRNARLIALLRHKQDAARAIGE